MISNQTLSDMFSWMAVIVPAIIGVINVAMRAQRFAIIAPFLIAVISGLGLHFRNVVSADKDGTILALGDRVVTSSQASRLQRALGGTKGTVGFNIVMFDAESRKYAEKLSEAFRLSAWTVRYVAANLTADVKQPVIGIRSETLRDQAQTVCQALIAADIGCQDIYVDERWEEGSIGVMVHQKP